MLCYDADGLDFVIDIDGDNVVGEGETGALVWAKPHPTPRKTGKPALAVTGKMLD
jgi:hypothetical protein